MASVNKVILIGNLGKDPETKYTPSGLQITKFSLATTDRIKKGDNYEDKTEWHNIVCFNKIAEVASEFLKKGLSVYIEGRISTNSWEDQSGTKKYWTEIVASHLKILSKRESNSGEGGQAHNSNYSAPSNQSSNNNNNNSNDSSSTPPVNNQSEDDLPF